jgi:predicted amidohydrolase
MEQIGRPARIVSLSFSPRGLTEVAAVVDQEGARGADLIALPETWQGQGDHPETLEGATIATLSDLARRHRTYIVCPLDRLDGARRVNSAVALDRTGRIVCVYDKVYPYWSEYDLRQPVQPGRDVPVFAADFGRVGMAICFDVNFPEVWRRLADAGAELVIWPSAYSAGTTLQAHALVHHYYIVTATWTGDCLVYDITGACLLDESSADLNISRITLDLDRGIYHENFNLAKRDRLLAERGADVYQEKYLPREQWFVLRAGRPGVSARALAGQYGLEELRAYIERSRRAIDELRDKGAQPALSAAGRA